MDGQRNLEWTWKVREKSGNLNMAMASSLQKIYLFCSRGERMFFLKGSLCPSPSSLGATLKGKKSTSKFEVIQLTTLE